MFAILALVLVQGWILAFDVFHVTALPIRLLPLAALACLFWHLWSANRPGLRVAQ